MLSLSQREAEERVHVQKARPLRRDRESPLSLWSVRPSVRRSVMEHVPSLSCSAFLEMESMRRPSLRRDQSPLPHAPMSRSHAAHPSLSLVIVASS